MQKKLKFKISSALKDIIGRDLIPDDYIAVFELVKNSFDAHATKVDIIFDNIYSNDSKITIKDNGKGMSYKDLTEKWLFVAYSAKKDQSEDEDYRESIYDNRYFAGAKGIGRFSCDKLGKRLYLETKPRKNSSTECHILDTQWEEFEKNIKDEFVDIEVFYKSDKFGKYKLKHGTVLEITDLRSDWDREKLLRLKDSLAKLIDPNQNNGRKFRIYLHIPEEIEEDKKITYRSNPENANYRKIVNGEVSNFIFKELGLKTTKIHSYIKKGFKTTELHDGGIMIYKIKEHSTFDFINDVSITLYYLNRAAKLTFARKMGMASKRFGHIFLYKNGFRIYPFGEPFEDPLKLDVRKSRKRYSTLGTDELLGQINIYGDNSELKETSSRGDGLIKNSSYFELEGYTLEVLSRLEKYVIDVQKWGLSLEDDYSDDEDIQTRVIDLITEVTGSKGILEFSHAPNFLEIISNSQVSSAESLVTNLSRIAATNGDDALVKLANDAGIRIYELKQAKEEAEREAELERAKANEANEILNEKISENLFLKSVKSQDLDEVVSFMHSIGISASTIDNYLSTIYQKISRGINIDQNEIKEAIEIVSFENRKILSISRFSTRANFKLYAEDVSLDLPEFVKEYIINVLRPLRSENINIIVKDLTLTDHIKSFKPIELTIMLDNFVSNSIRAKAQKIQILLDETKFGEIKISFEDDGNGIPEKYISQIFDFGFTTTSGSGLGLYHIKNIVKKLGGEIKVKNNQDKGATFTIVIK